MMSTKSSAEALVARALDTAPGETSPLAGDAAIVGVRDAAAIASVLREERQGVIGFVVIRFRHDLWALRFACGAEHDRRRRELVTLFAALADLAVRGGCPAIVGERGRSSHRLGEPAFRAWFAEFAHERLHRRPGNGAADDGASCEVTEDGDTTLPLLICESRTWADPTALARQFIAAPPIPLARDQQFAVAEIGPDGVRFHRLENRPPAAMAMRGTLMLTAEPVAAATDDSLAVDMDGGHRCWRS